MKTEQGDASVLANQKWRQYPDGPRGEVVLDGLYVGTRLARFDIIEQPIDLLDEPVGTVLKTGVSAYERIA